MSALPHLCLLTLVFVPSAPGSVGVSLGRSLGHLTLLRSSSHNCPLYNNQQDGKSLSSVHYRAVYSHLFLNG